MSDQHSPPSSPDDFQDPLENYEPKTYDDPVQQALVDHTVEAIQHAPYTAISPDTKVSDAIQQMASFHIACLLVEQDGKLVGVFSDRDVVDKVALEYDEVKDHPVSAIMTTNPVYVYDTDPSAAALSVMSVSGYRHVPILDVNENLTGIVSPQRVTAFLQRFFGSE